MRRVVITGMGVVSPLGNDLASFWGALKQGKNGIAPITRFDAGGFKAKLAAEVKDFDPLAYMDISEKLRSDLYAQFAMAAACQAMADSDVAGSVAPERISVYFGSGIGGIQTFSDEDKKLLQQGPRRVSPYFIPMLISNMAAGQIAIRFHCEGAAMPAVTACASGASAIGEGLRMIRHGYADAVISGGAEAPITAVGVAGFTNMQALSLAADADAASLPFDSRRSGFVIGEGGAALVLEEYQHAKARGAKIYAELCGYGATCDAYHITAPRPDAAGGARAMCDALAEAGGCAADDVLYINAHGTGTPMNDSIETKAIRDALGGKRAERALVSSTKSMTGHMLGAAGAAEAIACVQALCEQIAPPTINLREPDPACDLDYVPNQARPAKLTLALSNSLGFGGHNVCLAFRPI